MGYSEFSARQLQADLGAPIANRELERGISFVRDVATRGAWDSPSGRRSAGNGGELQTAVAASRDSCPGRRVPVQGHGLRDGPLWPLSRLAALAGAGRARGFGWTNYVHSCSKPASPRAPALTGKGGGDRRANHCSRASARVSTRFSRTCAAKRSSTGAWKSSW